MPLKNISTAYKLVMSFCSCFFQRCARHAELLTKYRGTQKCKHPLGCSFFKFSLIFTVFISYCHHSWLTGQHKKRGAFLSGQLSCLRAKLSSSLAGSAVEKHVAPQEVV